MEPSSCKCNGHLPINQTDQSNHTTKVSMPAEKESLITSDPYAALRHQRRFKRKTIILIFLITASMVLSVMSLLLSLWVHGRSTALPVSQENLCLPCDWIQKSPPGFTSDLEQLKKISEPHGMLCCAENEDQVKILLRLVTQKNGRDNNVNEIKCSNLNKNCSSGRSYLAAAHIVLRSRQGNNGNSTQRQSPVKGWSSSRSPAFAKNIRLEQDRLIIDKPGLYFVYSQLALLEYRDGGVERRERGGNRVEHAVQRWHQFYPGEETLARHTSIMTGGDVYVEHVSYVAGVFSLRLGDQLYVTLSSAHSHLTQPDPISSYFGLYRL